MKLCWRYQTLSRGLKSVLGCKFKMASPLDFNDPFDSASVAINMGETCGIEKGYSSVVAESLRGVHIGSTRLLCLSKNKGLSVNGDLLLWSHYADFGKGVRIGIDVDGLGYELVNMRYERNRPIVDLRGCSKEALSHVISSQLNNVYGVKGHAWRYENEIRLCVMLNAITPGVEVSDLGEVFCKIPPSRYRYVDFGPKISIESCLSAATTILQREELRHIKFRRAVMDPNKFKYRYEIFEAQETMVYK